MGLEIYSRDNCSRCEAVKAALAKKNIPYTEHIIDRTIFREAVVEMFPGAKMLPIVVKDGTWIGGRDELLQMLAQL